MPATERLPHPDDPEFAPIRADLGRLYILHKANMGLADWSDAEIIARSSDITSTLIVLGRMARASGDWPWLLRHRWFFNATERLFDGDNVVV